MEKSGKGILAMFIYCRGANRVGKVTNSGVDWDTVNERRPRGDRGEAVDLRDTGGGRDFSPLRNSTKTPLSKVITGLLIHITKVSFQHLLCLIIPQFLIVAFFSYLPCPFVVYLRFIYRELYKANHPPAFCCWPLQPLFNIYFPSNSATSMGQSYSLFLSLSAPTPRRFP